MMQCFVGELMRPFESKRTMIDILITPEQASHGILHLANHLEGEPGELERAIRPEQCDCGVELPDDVDMRRVVEMVAKAVA